MTKTTERRNFFPMMVNINGKKCLVVGAGKVAAEKIDGLLAYGANVTVVSPRAVPSVKKQARQGSVHWKKRRFSAKDVSDSFLVVAATNSPLVNSAVFRACKKYGALCNSVDDPENCDFFYPAVVRRGALQIAVSTNGHSPALASRLRRELEQHFGAEWSGWIEEIGRARKLLLGRKMPREFRRKQLLQMASAAAFEVYRRKRAAPRATRG